MDGLACDSRGESSDKGQQVLPFIGGMLPFMSGRSVTPFDPPCHDPSNRFSPPFYPLFTVKSERFCARNGQNRRPKAIGNDQSPVINGTKVHSLRAAKRANSAH